MLQVGGHSRGRARRGGVGRSPIASALMIALAVAHCGGQSVKHEGDGSDAGSDATGAMGGSGATDAKGGSGATTQGGSTSGTSPGGTGGTGGSGASCTGPSSGDCCTRGIWFDQGEELIPADDPCSVCYCNDVKKTICAPRDCTTCTHEGTTHPINVSFPSKDGCNSCSCTERGDVYCTHQACETDPICLDLQAYYANKVAAQKACPQSDFEPDPCMLTAFDSLPCGCNTAVSDASTLEAVANEYFANGCGQDPVCPPCSNIGGVAYCSGGMCVLGGYL